MSTFTLKMTAVLFMVIDHIYLYFFAPSTGIALLLTCIGRISYPLFLFCMVWGYHYTRNRKAYLLRLYLMSIFMTIFIYAIDYFLPTNQFGFGNHNIFLSLFLVGVLISTIELFQKDHKKGGILLSIIFSIQVLFYFIPSIIPFFRTVSGDFLTGIVPNIYLNEYGFEFVALGILMYFLKEKKSYFQVMYIIFCIAQLSNEIVWGNGLGIPTQWLMILALPLMMLYNNTKGYGMKYFFYIFYPAHTFLLFYLANFVLEHV